MEVLSALVSVVMAGIIFVIAFLVLCVIQLLSSFVKAIANPWFLLCVGCIAFIFAFLY